MLVIMSMINIELIRKINDKNIKNKRVTMIIEKENKKGLIYQHGHQNNLNQCQVVI